MKSIAINAMALVQDRPIGIERYARNVIGNLNLGEQLVMCFTRRGIDLRDRLGADFLQRHPVLKHNTITAGSTATRILIEMLVLSWMARKVDTILSINNFGPLWGKPAQRRVVIIHDVWFMSEDFEGRKIERALFRMLIALQIRRAHRIITISEFSKREIVRYFNPKGNKVVIVRNCFSEPPPRSDEQAKTMDRNLLLVGSDRKNKNVYRAIAGFCEFVQAGEYPDLTLTIVGSYGLEFVKKTQNNFEKYLHLIEFAGYVSDVELDQKYSRCTAVLFVSLYEGYGLPAIEAALKGKPVIVSERTACAEELGTLGIAVNGRDPCSIARGIGRALVQSVDRDGCDYSAFASRQYDCAAQVATLNAALMSFDD